MNAPPNSRPPPLGWMRRLSRFAVLQGSRRRAIAVLGGASVGDFFVPALPTQTSVIALGLLQPQRAAWVALVFALAAAVGAGLLAVLLMGASAYAQQFGEARFGSEWTQVVQTVRDYGVWAVLLASIFPSPPRLLTAATLLSGAAAWAVLLAVFAGKLIWFGLFLLLLTRAPALLARVPLLGRAVPRFRAFQAEVLAQESHRIAGRVASSSSGQAPRP